MSPHDHQPPARHRVRPVPPSKPVVPALPASHAAVEPAAAPLPAEVRPTYEIGYGKPPVHSRFQKGQSGNPKGRKKGSKNLSTLVTELLDERIAVNTPSGRRNVSRVEMLLRKLIEIGAKGNPRAIDQILRQYALAQAVTTPPAASSSEIVPDVTEADAASLALLRDLMLAEFAQGDARPS
jgi:hypothetical protein